MYFEEGNYHRRVFGRLVGRIPSCSKQNGRRNPRAIVGGFAVVAMIVLWDGTEEWILVKVSFSQCLSSRWICDETNRLFFLNKSLLSCWTATEISQTPSQKMTEHKQQTRWTAKMPVIG